MVGGAACIDDVSITHLSFGKEYTAAVEAKQVAQQEAERAQLVAPDMSVSMSSHNSDASDGLLSSTSARTLSPRST